MGSMGDAYSHGLKQVGGVCVCFGGGEGERWGCRRVGGVWGRGGEEVGGVHIEADKEI